MHPPSSSRAEAEFRVRLLPGARALSAAAWDRCAGGGNPTLRHAFFAALEESGAAAAGAGWRPQHLALETAGRIEALMPLYLKSHSMGEYVFDHGWAEAYEQAGGRYYPKLQAGVPFTPVPGRRLLVAPDAAPGAREALIAAARRMTGATGTSSLHIAFPLEDEWHALGAAGFLQRAGVQFHWTNRGYRDFDDFLSSLASRKRKQMRRERHVAQSIPGIAFETLCGGAITESHWDAFYGFYLSTAEKKWGIAYLPRAFFSLLGQTLPEVTVLMLALREGRTVAGALHILGPEALLGRYWGCAEEHPFLHFELCYYRAIEFAIARGLVRVEAGAQGPHKLLRGYEPVATYSAHWIADPALRAAVERYLAHERRHIERETDWLALHAPYRKEG